MKKIALLVCLFAGTAHAQMAPNGKAPVVANQLYYAFFGDSRTFGSAATNKCQAVTPFNGLHTISGIGVPPSPTTYAYDCIIAAWLDTTSSLSNVGSGTGLGNGVYTNFGVPNNGIKQSIVKAGGATTAAITSVGSGYTLNDVLTEVGGTCTTQPQLTATNVTSGQVTGVSITTVGVCSVYPGNTSGLVSVTGGTGSGAQFTVTAAPMSSAITFTTFASGINDSQNVNSLQPGGNYCTGCSSSTAIAQFKTDLKNWVATVKTQAPNAVIVLFTFPNLAYLQNSNWAVGTTPDVWGRGMNADIRAYASITPNNGACSPFNGGAAPGDGGCATFLVVDLACDTNAYLAANQNPPNGIHPSNAGHLDWANLIETQTQTPALPSSSCPMSPSGITTDGAGNPITPPFNPVN